MLRRVERTRPVAAVAAAITIALALASTDCRANVCGNGIIENAEACDGGVAHGSCDKTCHIHCAAGYQDCNGDGRDGCEVNLSKGQCSPIALATGLQGTIGKLLLDETTAYATAKVPASATTNNEETWTVYQAPKRGKGSGVFESAIYSASDFALDDAYLYSCDFFGLASNATRKPQCGSHGCGGGLDRVGGSPTLLAVDDTYLYWTTTTVYSNCPVARYNDGCGGRLNRVAKNEMGQPSPNVVVLGAWHSSSTAADGWTTDATDLVLDADNVYWRTFNRDPSTYAQSPVVQISALPKTGGDTVPIGTYGGDGLLVDDTYLYSWQTRGGQNFEQNGGLVRGLKTGGDSEFFRDTPYHPFAVDNVGVYYWDAQGLHMIVKATGDDTVLTALGSITPGPTITDDEFVFYVDSAGQSLSRIHKP